MRIGIEYGLTRSELDIADTAYVASRVASPPSALADPVATLRAGLEQPHDFPALRRALTPEDSVVVVVDERLPLLAQLLVPVLEHITSAGVAPSAITLLCSSSSHEQAWLEQLPEELEEVRCEVHAPLDRRRLSFVNRLSGGRDLFVNRTVVDAAQIVLLTSLRYDVLHGMSGEGALYPLLGDASARKEASTHYSLEPPGHHTWPVQKDAEEVTWLLGAPFFVQIIEGAGDSIADVVCGIAPSLTEGRQRLQQRWRRTVERQADLVLATVSGNPNHQGFQDLADAVVSASRVLRPRGRLVVLSEVNLEGTPGLEVLTEADDPADALRTIRRQQDFDLRAAWQWAMVAQEQQLFVLSATPGQLIENLFATPLEDLSEVQRLVASSEDCLHLPDAHKTLAIVED